jgi:hypothetical protein
VGQLAVINQVKIAAQQSISSQIRLTVLIRGETSNPTIWNIPRTNPLSVLWLLIRITGFIIGFAIFMSLGIQSPWRSIQYAAGFIIYSIVGYNLAFPVESWVSDAYKTISYTDKK